MRELRDKVAFITGGASGIGLGIAQAFLDRQMKIVIADLNGLHLERAASALAAAHGRVEFMRVDVRSRSMLARAAQDAVRAFGKVHVLCNNAGISSSRPVAAATYEEWDELLSTNLGGVINGVVTFLPLMMAHGEGGHIVNTASMAAFIPLPDEGAIYSTSKFAVRGLTESLRLSLWRYDIGVSGLYPGLTQSQLSDSESSLPSGSCGDKSALESGARKAALRAGMHPREVGEHVVQGILRNASCILTHAEFKQELQELSDEILSAFPQAQTVGPERLAYERSRRNRIAAAKAAMRTRIG